MKAIEKREVGELKNKRDRLIQFRVSEVEYRMIEQLCGQWGGKVSDTIREAIRFRHEKTFAYYTPGGKKKLSEAVGGVIGELTPEQACEQIGGTVVTRNGIPMCSQKHGALTRYSPLSKPELFKK